MTSFHAENSPDTDGHLWHSRQFVADWIHQREELASEQDRARHSRILGYLIAAVKHQHHAPLRLLDLGAGWGRFIKPLLKEFSQSTAVAFDYSLPMLEAARENLGDLQQRVEFVHGDLTAERSISGLNGRFDLIFTSQTLHHFEAGVLSRIYQQINDSLSPNGLFVNFDRVSRPPVLAARLAYRAAIELPFSADKPCKTRRMDRFTLELDRKLTALFGQGKRRAHDVMLAEHVDMLKAANLEVNWLPLGPQRFMLCGMRLAKASNP